MARKDLDGTKHGRKDKQKKTIAREAYTQKSTRLKVALLEKRKVDVSCVSDSCATDTRKSKKSDNRPK